jgi:hypothetical protein
MRKYALMAALAGTIFATAIDSYLAILRQNDINIDIGSSGALTRLPAIRQFD